MKRKLDLFRQRDEEEQHDSTLKLTIDQTKQVEALEGVKAAVESLHTLINEQEPLDLSVLTDELKTLHTTLDFSDEFKALQEEVRNSKVETVDVNKFNDLIKAVQENKPLPVNIDLSKLEKAIIRVEQRIQEGSTGPEQAPADFQPVRRVIKVGSRLVFDDQPTPTANRGGGGGSSDLKNNKSIRHQVIDISASGANTIVSAQGGLRIKVLSAVLISAGTVSITWQSDASALSGAVPLIANSGYVLPASSPAQGEYLETGSGEALKISLSGNIQVTGHMTYYLE